MTRSRNDIELGSYEFNGKPGAGPRDQSRSKLLFGVEKNRNDPGVEAQLIRPVRLNKNDSSAGSRSRLASQESPPRVANSDLMPNATSFLTERAAKRQNTMLHRKSPVRGAVTMNNSGRPPIPGQRNNNA